MESHSSTPSILPPSPPPLRPQVSHNLKENGNDKNNGVGYLHSTKNLPPQRKTSHLHFTKSTNTYKNNLQSSKKLFAMTPLVEEAGTLSKRVRCSENGEEEQQEIKNKEEENGTEETSKTYNQNTYEGNTEQSNFTVEHDAELDNDNSIIALSNRRQESTDCDSIDYSLRSEESPVTALLSPTASTTTLPYNSSLDTPRVEDTYKVNDSFDSWNNHNEKERKHSVDCKIYEHANNKNQFNEELEENELLSSDINEEVREYSLKNNDNEVCEESNQNGKYEMQEMNTLRKEEKYECQENADINDHLMQCVKSPGDNNTKRKLPLSTLPSSSSLSSSSALLSEHEEELEEEEKYGQQIEEEHEQEEHLEKSQSTLSTITVSSSSTSQEDNEHQSVAYEEEQDEIKKLSEINGDKESSDEEDEIKDSSSSSSSLYRRNDDLFILEEEVEEEEQELEKEELQEEEEQDRAETNVQEEEKVITRKLSSSDADTRNFILPPPMPLSPCETNHLLSLNVSDEVKYNNDSDTCLRTNEEHQQKYVAKGNTEEEHEEMELPDSDKREESDKQVYTSNIIANEFDNNENDSTMPDVKSVNNKCEINNNDHSSVVTTATSDTSRIDNNNDVIDNEVNVVADGDMDVNNGSHKVVQVKKLVTRELELPLADEEQQSDREHTPHDKVIQWPEDNNTHDEPKTSSVQETTTFVHKSHPSTLTSELSSIILLSSSSTPPPLALLPRTEQVKTQTHLSLLQETHSKDNKQATKRAQKTTLTGKDHQQQIQQEQQMSREQREEINKLIRKAFVELGGKLAKTNVNSREKVNESTNNKYNNKNYSNSSMMRNKINKGDSGSKDANRHINKITNSQAENVHGVQLGRLCRALSEFGISFDVEKFWKENTLLFANKENKSNQHDKERTEHSFHSLQLFPFRSQSNEYEQEEDHGILTYNTFAHIIKTALLQGKDYMYSDDSTTNVPTHTLNQNKSQLQLNKHNDLTSKNKTSYQYMTLASERSSDLLMSSILSLHETINNANYSNNNKNTLEKVTHSEQSREKPNDALAELQCEESSTHSNRSSPDVHMEHIDVTRAKGNNRDKVVRNTASIDSKEETSTVTTTPQQTCTNHAEESLNELHSAHIAENSSMIDSDLDSCHYTPHISRFTSASSITSSARAPSISSSYYEDSAVNVEFPEVTPTSAIAELCRRIRHRLYNNKRMALQDRERERRSAKKSEPIQLDEHSDRANNMNAIKSVQVSNKHTHRMKLAEDKMKVEKNELHKKPTLAINVRKSEKNIKVVINDKSDNTKTNSLITAPTTTISTTTTSISNKAGNGATVTMVANQKSHTIKRHSKQTKHNKNKNLHSPSQPSMTSTPVLPADNAKVPRSSGGASHSVPEQRTSISASSISSSPMPKRPSLVATLHRPVIISSKVEEELVRLSPYYTKRFVQFRHASHLRSSDSNISYSSNIHFSTNQNKSSEKVVGIDSASSANTTSLEPATTIQSENVLLLEEKRINEPENFHRHSEPAQERIATPALSSASAPSSAASLPLPSRHFTSPFRSRTPEWSSHLGTEPVRWSSNVSELFEQWKHERAFPSLSRPIRHASATPFTNFPTTHHGRQNAHRPKRKVKKCNGINNDDVVKEQSDNAKNSHHDQKEEHKHTYSTFRRHYEQNWINGHNICSLDNTKGNKEVYKYHNSTKENSVGSSWQVNDPSCHNEGSLHTSPSLNLPYASTDKLHEGVCNVTTEDCSTHNISSKYVPGTEQKNNLFSEDREKIKSTYSPPKQRTTANLAIQWGRMKSCNHSSKVNTLLNSIYNSYRYNDAYDKNDRCNAHRVFVDDYNDDKGNNDAITSNVVDKNTNDGEEIKQVHSVLNALYTTKAELETLLHERIHSSSRTNNAVQITREQRVINQIKQKLNQVLDDISRYMQRVAPNTNIICDSNY